jgi:drug/metabolite transporter (DMT)-like permease
MIPVATVPANAVSADPAAPSFAWLTAFELLLLAAIWGASFLFMRVAAPEFGALPLASVRLASGALVLLPFVWTARRHLPVSLWPKLAFIGAVNSAIPFALFAWAASRAPAGVSAIANSMTVLFTALVAFVLYRERIGWLRGIGLVSGFVGVVVLASGKTNGPGAMEAAIAGSAAALMYAIAVNLIKRFFTGVPPVAIAASTLLFAAIMLVPFGLAQWPEGAVSGRAWASAIAIGVLCTGFAYALYFRLINRVGPGRAVTVTYLVPLFAVGWAYAVLGEAITVPMLVAGALILGGVALSQKAAKR